jgi:hypothetical protein
MRFGPLLPALMPADEQSLTATLLRLTAERDALASLLEATPDSHKERVRQILADIQFAIDEVTVALEPWLPT